MLSTYFAKKDRRKPYVQYIYMEGKVEEVEGEFEIRKAAVMPFPNQKNEEKNLNPVFEEPWEQAK